MNSHIKTNASGGTDAWKRRLFIAAYLAGTVTVMIAWLVALSWAGLSVLGLFV
jgi:hypothetical protein